MKKELRCYGSYAVTGTSIFPPTQKEMFCCCENNYLFSASTSTMIVNSAWNVVAPTQVLGTYSIMPLIMFAMTDMALDP